MHTTRLRKPSHKALRLAAARAYREVDLPASRAKRFLDLYKKIIRKFSDFLYYREKDSLNPSINGLGSLTSAEEFARYLIRLCGESQSTFVSKVEQLEQELDEVILTLKQEAR